MHNFNIGHSGSNQAHLIKVPVLIYHGDNDLWISVDKAKDNALQIGKKKCVIIIKK
jgi:hypothetical protein